jgi:hypothetical protein
MIIEWKTATIECYWRNVTYINLLGDTGYVFNEFYDDIEQYLDSLDSKP